MKWINLTLENEKKLKKGHYYIVYRKPNGVNVSKTVALWGRTAPNGCKPGEWTTLDRWNEYADYQFFEKAYEITNREAIRCMKLIIPNRNKDGNWE